MDMLTVDLSAQPAAKVGDPVELWGPNLPIEEVAMYAGTVPYELLCGVHKRLAFKEINGMTPTEYRKHHLAEKSPAP